MDGCCIPMALPINRGGFWRFAFRLATSVSLVGAVFTLRIWDNEARSGAPVRVSDSVTNASRWEFEAENNRVYHTLPQAEVDAGTPSLVVGARYYCVIFANFASETEPQPIARFIAEVQS